MTLYSYEVRNIVNKNYAKLGTYNPNSLWAKYEGSVTHIDGNILVVILITRRLKKKPLIN